MDTRDAARTTRLATWSGVLLWVVFVAVLSVGTDEQLPPAFWIVPTAGLLLVAATPWSVPRLLDLWGAGQRLVALAGAVAAGAICAFLLRTLRAVVAGALATTGPSAAMSAYAVVMAVGALAWLAILAVVRWLDARACRAEAP